MNTKTRKLSLRHMLLALCIVPALIVSVVLTAFAIFKLRSSMIEETLNTLKTASYVTEEVYNTMSGQWQDIDGLVYKGDVLISNNNDTLDAIKRDTDCDVTIFYGDTRVATTITDTSTGQRLIGTTCATEVRNSVLNNRTTYSSTDTVINGIKYYTFYVPIIEDGNVIGMVFAGKSSESVQKDLRHVLIVSLLIGILSLLFTAVCGVFIATRIAKGIKTCSDSLDLIASGDISNKDNIPLLEKLCSDKTEIGQISNCVLKLHSKFSEIILNLQHAVSTLHTVVTELAEASDTAKQNTDDVGSAIEDVAHGATSQAQDTQSAQEHTVAIGTSIEQVVADTEELLDTLHNMENVQKDAMSSMLNVVESAKQSDEVVSRIKEQTSSTYDAAMNINKVVDMISEITTQTTLLSLNASIEAARAGEAGRGFSVVASEIQKLADQSNQSAKEIQEIVTDVMKQSDATVVETDNLVKHALEQSKLITATMANFEKLKSNIDRTSEGVTEIANAVKLVEEAKNALVDIIESLSAISEENAAAAEETSASSDILVETLHKLDNDITELESTSANIKQDIAYFK